MTSRIVAASFAAVLLQAGSAQGAAPITPIPIATLAEEPVVSAPVLSPDGRSIAARGNADGKVKLVLIDADHVDAKPRVLDLGDGTINDVQWAGSHRVLLQVARKGTYYGVPMPITRLVALDTGTGVATYLDEHSLGVWAGDILYVDPAGAWMLVSSQNSAAQTPSVKRIDLATGAVEQIEKPRPDVWNWFADEHGVVRAGISYDERKWTIWYRAAPDAPLKPLRAKVAKDEDGAVDALHFTSDAQSGVIVTNSRTGRFGAYRYDFNTGTIGEALYEHPKVDVDALVRDPRAGKLAGFRYEDDRRRTEWIDPEMRALQLRIDKALPGSDNAVVSRSLDGNRMLLRAEGGSTPDLYYLFDRVAKTFQPILQPYDRLANASLAPVTAVTYPARDGLEIPAYLTLPPGRDARNLPLIVMPHGGPFMRDHWEYDSFVQMLASRGYAVLQPQFRGSTGYGKSYLEKGYGQWGRAMQDDLDDGMDWLAKSGRIDPKRVCMLGASYGGYAALWGAIRNPERYRCAVSYAGVTDLPAQLSADRASFGPPRYFRRWKAKLSGEDGFDLHLVSPYDQAKRLTVPVLIGHGEKDTTVPPTQGHRMVDALRSRRAEVESVFYKEDGHDFSHPGDLADFLTRVEAFLAKHNPA